MAVHMHAMGHVGSAALPLFLAADKRTSAEHARFFLHEYDWGFGERQTLRRIEEATKRLRNDIEISKSIIQSRAPDIPAYIIDAIRGEAPAIINPDEAKKLGIISEIGELTKSGRIAVWLSGTAP